MYAIQRTHVYTLHGLVLEVFAGTAVRMHQQSVYYQKENIPGVRPVIPSGPQTRKRQKKNRAIDGRQEVFEVW